MLFRKKTANFISDIDLFLDEFNRSHPKSKEQIAEIKKYQKIYALRDGSAEKDK